MWIINYSIIQLFIYFDQSYIWVRLEHGITEQVCNYLTCKINVICLSDSVFLVQLTGRECNNTAVLTSIREIEGVKVKKG